MINNSMSKRWKDNLAIIVSVIVLIGSTLGWVHEHGKRAAADALLNDQVQRNKRSLEAHNLELIEYRLEKVDEKVDRILVLLGD